MCIYIYIYIYIKRERYTHIHIHMLCICVYTYIHNRHIYIYIERERDAFKTTNSKASTKLPALMARRKLHRKSRAGSPDFYYKNIFTLPSQISTITNYLLEATN